MIDWRIRDPRKDFRAHGKGSQRDQTLQSKLRRRRPQYRGENIATTLTGVPPQKTLPTDNASHLNPATSTHHTTPFRGLTQFNATPESRRHAGLKQRLTLFKGHSYQFQQTTSYFSGKFFYRSVRTN